MDGLLGYDPIVAGRFIGYGNLSFGLLATSGLLLTAAVATWVAGRGGGRLPVAATVLGCGVLVIGMDGAPQLGRDFGGVLASVPGFLLLAMLLTRTRVTVTRLLAILGAAVVAVGTVAYLDWLRPADQRTHLGRFVDQLLSGEAWTVVSRKAQANLDILLGSSLAWMLPVALVAAWWLVRPRAGLLRGGAPGGLSRPHTAGLRAGLLAVALSLTLGAAVNDSGVAVPATAAALLVPLLVWLAAAPREDGDVADGTASSDQDGDAHRVTVVSRGSTVSNA
jgi:tryptophan-rich sensory protein